MKTVFSIMFAGMSLLFLNPFASAQGPYLKAVHGRFETSDVRIECEVSDGVLRVQQNFTAKLIERLLCDETKDTNIFPEGAFVEARVHHVFDCRHICEIDEVGLIDEDGVNEDTKRFIGIEGIGAHRGHIFLHNAKGRVIAHGQMLGLDFVKTTDNGEKCFVLRGTIRLEGRRNNKSTVIQYRFGKCGFPDDCKEIKDALCNTENWEGSFRLLGVTTKSDRGRRRPGRDRDGDRNTDNTDETDEIDDTNDGN